MKRTVDRFIVHKFYLHIDSMNLMNYLDAIGKGKTKPRPFLPPSGKV